MKNEDTIYDEVLFSRRTEFLFITLTVLFLLLFIWRMLASSLDFLAGIFLFFFCFFLFYSLNYRMLIIRITSGALKLSFGIFKWVIPLDNVGECQLDDDLPVLMKYGGAGVHFMLVHKRYRASLNFLEYSRVVIRLKRKAGFMWDISFSTCRPNEVIQLIREVVSA